MNMTTESIGDVAIVRVSETRLMYPLLSEFADAVTALIKSGERKVLIDLAPVVYVDSASIGCLMDLYRQANAAGATLKLSGVQKRVATMLTMTGVQQFIDVHGDDLSVLCKLFHLAGHPIVETDTESQQQIRMVDGIIGVKGSVHPQHVQAEFFLAGKCSQPHQCHGHRDTCLVGKLLQLLAGIGRDDPPATVDHRPLGSLDGGSNLFQLFLRSLE